MLIIEDFGLLSVENPRKVVTVNNITGYQCL